MTISGTTVPIGELSRLTGCNIENVRYFERIGILPVPFRRGKYRAYDPADVRRLSFVRRAGELGFPIDAVRKLLAFADGSSASCSQARALANTHLADVRTKIADLRRMKQVLADTISACDADDHAVCPLLETLWTAKMR